MQSKTFLRYGTGAALALGCVLAVQTSMASAGSSSPLLLSDGRMTFALQRTGQTVAEALTGAGITLQPEDILLPSLDTPLASVNHIFLSRQRSIRVTVGTEPPRTIRTPSVTAGEILAEAGIPLSPTDRVTPGTQMPIPDNGTIIITRVAEETRMEEETIDPDTTVRADGTLPLGEEHVVEQGHAGRAEVTVYVRSENGTVVERRVQARRVLEPARPRIVRRGTKIVVTDAEVGRASWFHTATGTAAHRTLPFGARIRVVRTDTGTSVIARIADRGPFLPGRVIDLSTDVFRALAPLSVGTIPVRVEHLQ